MFSYCESTSAFPSSTLCSTRLADGIAAAITIGIINYVFLGFQFTVDGFYIASFEIWLATTVVFIGSGNVGYTLLQYRLGNNELLTGFLENIKWVPFL